MIRDIERNVASRQTKAEAEHPRLRRLLKIAKRIHAQQRHDKGKAHKPYEFGVKVGVVSTRKESFVVGMQSLPGNPYDGHTLKASLQQVQGTSKNPTFLMNGARHIS